MRSTLAKLFAIDLRSLAAFRVAIAILLLVDLGVRATDLGAMYTDDGMFSRVLICRHFSAWSWSFHFGSGSAWFQAVLFGLAGVFTCALLVGYETRLAAIASWIMLVSLQNRVPNILTGADNLARLLLLWGLFLPLGRVWSVDAWLARRRGVARGRAEPVVSVASAAILLQMAFMYLFSAFFKSNGEWFSGDAIAAILPDGFYGRPVALGFLEYPSVLAMLTVGVLALEWIGPVFLFSPIRTGGIRLLVVALLASMHVAIEVLLHVGLFSFASLCGLLLFLPPSFWNRFAGSIDEADESDEVDSTTTAPGRSRRPFLVAQGVCALALAFVLFANLNELPGRFAPWTPLPRFEPLTVSCGLGQKWDMFATAPPKNGWYVARAILVGGARVDLLRDGAAAVWERPRDPAGAYPSHRWRKCFREMSYTDERGYQVFREPVAKYLCRAWNRGQPAGRRIADFALVFCTEEADEYGLESSPESVRETHVHLSASDL